MPTHVLKEYQRETLETLGRFCDGIRQTRASGQGNPAKAAFEALMNRDYFEVPQMPGVAYVCLRVPTGGGKTLIAAHAVGVIAKRLGKLEHPLVLWVAPSTTIRDQTLRSLKDRQHPNYAALKDGLGVPFEVLTLEDALAANRSVVASGAVIAVATIQSYRIDEEGDRRIYQDNGTVMDHFTAMPAAARAGLERGDGERTPLSLANVFKAYGPIVIMDEAHNARTRISFESLARLGPLAVLELTATPNQIQDPDKGSYASNVLHTVSALSLKNEGMIKLPVELESRKDWLQVLATTVSRRTELAERARVWGLTSGRYVRPIALIQAQAKNKNRETHTVEKVREALIQQMNVPAENIRIATGDHDDLGTDDLSLPSCPVEYVITVNKLREGWDCPFAYVLGSIGNVATETAVEQLLGRILRMPHARPTGVRELDRAYAVVLSDDVALTAKNLADSLVTQCGFDKVSAGDAFRVQRRLDDQPTLFYSSIPVTAPPDLTQLPPAIRTKLTFEPKTNTIQVRRPLVREEAQALRDILPAPTDREAVENYWQDEREVGTASKKLDEGAQPMRIPQLAVRDGADLFRFEPVELDEFTWDLNNCTLAFSNAEFPPELLVGRHATVDLTKEGAVRIGHIENVLLRQESFIPNSDRWDKATLVRWFDQELHRGGQNTGLSASESQAWLNRVLTHATTVRGIGLSMLVRRRHELAELIFDRITAHGRSQVRKAAQQLFANSGVRRLDTTYDLAFELREEKYCPNKRYVSPFAFKKHAFDLIGEMGHEESRCAKAIDDNPNVKRWVRNMVYESAGGFSLPLSPGRFFPDFLAELHDDRIAIIEYKGSHIAEVAKEQHKRDVGKMWAERSNGRGLFVWVVDSDWAALEAGLA